MSTSYKVLLTGGNGMVGKNILQHPNARNFNFLAPTRADLDLRDYAKTQEYFFKHSPDFVIHAAGLVGGIEANITKPVDFLVENVDLGRNVIMASRSAGVKNLLNLSSSCVYPCNAPNPLSENFVFQGGLEPTNEGYALAKIFAMRLCEYLHKEDTSLQYKTFIPCNLYGLFDKFDPEHSHLIPAIIYKIHRAKLSGDKTVEIWGDGTARREFMFAGDLADAVLCALDNFASLPDLMNIGLGFDYSINEYYDVAAKVIGWQGVFVHNLTRPVGMMQKLVSIQRQSRWGWSSSTSLEVGLSKTYDYFLKVSNEF